MHIYYNVNGCCCDMFTKNIKKKSIIKNGFLGCVISKAQCPTGIGELEAV